MSRQTMGSIAGVPGEVRFQQQFQQDPLRVVAAVGQWLRTTRHGGHSLNVHVEGQVIDAVNAACSRYGLTKTALIHTLLLCFLERVDGVTPVRVDFPLLRPPPPETIEEVPGFYL